MPMNPQMGAAAAAGGMPPQQGMPQQGMPQQGAMQEEEDNNGQVPIDEIVETLKQVIPQALDQNGYLDLSKLLMIWQQYSKIPFQAVMQVLESNPDLLENILVEGQFSGIIVNGKTISIEEMTAMGGRGAQ